MTDTQIEYTKKRKIKVDDYLNIDGPCQFQLGTSSLNPFAISSSSTYTMTFTNGPTSARTDPGTALTLYIQKVSGYATLVFEVGNLGSVAVSVSTAPMRFNEVIPTRYCPNTTASLQVAIVQQMLSGGAGVLGSPRIDYAGSLRIFSSASGGNFPIGTNCALQGSEFVFCYKCLDSLS